MQVTRPLLCAAAVLTLLISACSQPADLTVPTLEPQFGTSKNDIGFNVMQSPTGDIYVLSETENRYYTYDSEYEDSEAELHMEEDLILSRYSKSGTLIRTSVVLEDRCDGFDYECPYDVVQPRGLYADGNGYTYVLFASQGYGCQVRKIDATGNIVEEIYLQYCHPDLAVSAAVDTGGNIYVGQNRYDFDWEIGEYFIISSVAKYSTNGVLLWQQSSTVGAPYDITVSSSGSVYVVGNQGMARYTNSGNLIWTKPGNFEEVIISGSNLYTRYRKDVRKYDGTGKQLWLKTQSGLRTIVLQAMDGDGSGNVYLSGKYDADSSSNLSMNAMIRKLNSSGSVLWTKTYGTSAYDDAKGIATITGSEIYTTGLTKGSLAHTNKGGEDGYLRKFSSSGSTVWTR